MKRRYYRRKKGIAKKEKPFFKESSSAVQTKEEKRPFFQTKGSEGLAVGQPGDKYEIEADAMADAVMSNSSKSSGIQRKEITTIQRVEEEKGVQTKIQRQAEEEPAIQTQGAAEEVQMQAEEEQVQMTSEEEEVQMQAEEDEVQAKSEEEEVQMQSEEEEPAIQAKGQGKLKASNQLSNRIKQSSGNGQALSPKTKQQMEGAFGTDFSSVNIHTSSDAVQMNKELKAHAFTHGHDVYFNQGKFQPETSEGKHLLAHELTHVVQQSEKRDGTQKSVQLLRISGGGFGRALERFTDRENISPRALRRLRRSREFMNIARTLDRHYVDREISSRFNPEYDSDHRIIGGVPTIPRRFLGKKELYVSWTSTGARFDSSHSSTNVLNGDVIYIHRNTDLGFIQEIAHEASHALNHVTGQMQIAGDILSSVRGGIQEEISVRNSEAQIISQINPSGLSGTFSPVGSTVPAQVARDFAPGIGLTYLENFFFGYRLRETQLGEGLTNEQASSIRRRISNGSGSRSTEIANPSQSTASEYARTWRDREAAKRNWRQFNSGAQHNNPEAKENQLQRHARQFFRGLIRYTNLPEPNSARR